MNECRQNICRPDQLCKNTRGSYKCIDLCPNGMTKEENGSCIGGCIYLMSSDSKVQNHILIVAPYFQQKSSELVWANIFPLPPLKKLGLHWFLCQYLICLHLSLQIRWGRWTDEKRSGLCVNGWKERSPVTCVSQRSEIITCSSESHYV